MQANEIRINNWVIDESGSVLKIVTGKSIDEAINFRPIKLMPEILEKCGFQLEDNCASRMVDLKKNILLSVYPDGSAKIYCENPNEAYLDLPNNIVFLHQLQNLFHSLKGEDLEIEL